MPRALPLLALCLLAACSATSPRPRPGCHRRIVGGWAADISRFPWQLAVLHGGSYQCGASIVSAGWALTASHCIDGLVGSMLSLRGGSTYKDSGGTVVGVATSRMHERYDPQTYDYDVAVLQVSRSLSGANMRPVCLAPDRYDPPAGLVVTVTGWGRTSSGEDLADRLLRVDVRIVDRGTCRHIFADAYPVTERMVCAGRAGSSVCKGDSGGPLVSGCTQVGVVSWGNNRCELVGAVYASVGALRSWIRAATGV